MRMLVAHDEFGNIKSAAVAPKKPNLRAALKPQRGEFIIELEVDVVGPGELRRNPQVLIDNYLIDTATGRLVRKEYP